MEELLFIRPTKEYEKQAYDYIQEFKKSNSPINGVGGLDCYLDNYDEWLEKLEIERKMQPTPDRVPAGTFMLIRKSDNKLLGIVNIRMSLNDKLLQHSGHIGYGIRPSERKKGYASYQLYCALKFCDENGIDRALLTCDKNNIGSAKTIQNCYGVLENEIQEENRITQRYWINVKEALEKLDEKYMINTEKGRR